MSNDNLYALLSATREVATPAEPAFFGVQAAIVTNVQDPERSGRVRVCLPALPGKPETGWARVVQPAAGAGRGFYWLPHTNDEVLVAFERGQANRAFVLRALWNCKDAPMSAAYTDENTAVMLQSRSGHQVILDDTSGSEKIVIADQSGKRSITFDAAGGQLLIECAEGDLELSAANRILLACEDLEVVTTKKATVHVGGAFVLEVKGSASLAAGPVMNLRASRIEINSPGAAGNEAGGGASRGKAEAAPHRGDAGSGRTRVRTGRAQAGGSARQRSGPLAARADRDLSRDLEAPARSAAPAPPAGGLVVLEVLDQSGQPMPGVLVRIFHQGQICGSAHAAADGLARFEGLPHADEYEIEIEGHEVALVTGEVDQGPERSR